MFGTTSSLNFTFKEFRITFYLRTAATTKLATITKFIIIIHRQMQITNIIISNETICKIPKRTHLDGTRPIQITISIINIPIRILMLHDRL